MACVVMAPWVARNMAVFRKSTTLSTGEGLALLGANCHRRPGPGSRVVEPPVFAQWGSAGDESVVSAHDQHLALQFAEHHAVASRPSCWRGSAGSGNLNELIQEAHIESREGRPVPASLAGLAVYYLMIPLGIAGVVIFRKYRIRSAGSFLAPAWVRTVVSALVYGLIRFRDPVRGPSCRAGRAPSIALLAGAVVRPAGAQRMSSRVSRLVQLGEESPCASTELDLPPPGPRRTKAMMTAGRAPAMGPAMYNQ